MTITITTITTTKNSFRVYISIGTLLRALREGSQCFSTKTWETAILSYPLELNKLRLGVVPWMTQGYTVSIWQGWL